MLGERDRARRDGGRRAPLLGKRGHRCREELVQMWTCGRILRDFGGCYVKVDIEGGEMRALLGARRFMTEGSPPSKVAVEVSQMKNKTAFWSLMRGWGDVPIAAFCPNDTRCDPSSSDAVDVVFSRD